MRKISLFLFALLICVAIVPGVRGADSGTCVSGNSGAPIKIEIFSDFQCPACRAFYLGTMRQIFTEYGDTGKACIIYREFPLAMHSHSKAAARYGHAALRLGTRQWTQVADALFQQQDLWANSGDIDSVVSKALGASEMPAFRKQLQDPSLGGAIEADLGLGMQKGVNSTPTFFVTSKGKTEKIAVVVQYPILKRYLDNLLGR